MYVFKLPAYTKVARHERNVCYLVYMQANVKIGVTRQEMVELCA